MFLHYILKRKEDDLLFKCFKAQYNEPTKGDWCSQIKMDLEEFGIDDDFNYLKKLSKYKMKKIIREAFKNNAFDDLLEKQMTYSKGNELVYGELKMRSYLKNQNINTKNKSLFSL